MIGQEARGAWQEIESHLRPYLARRVASPSDVDDLVQDIFVRMHQSLPGLQDGERFGAWVYRIARNAIVDRARRQARRPTVGWSDELEPPADSSPAVDDLQSDLAECVALFVGRLASPYREAITLTELQGLPHRQAAEMLGISVSGMKSRVQRGRSMIRDMFKACCEISVDCRGRVVDCEPRNLDKAPSDCSNPASLRQTKPQARR